MAALATAAAASDWATEAMTPVQAFATIAPRKGESGNWIVWLAMTTAGLFRAAGISIGYLFLKGFETRIRAGVAGTVFLVALGLAFLAGLSST